MLIIVTCSPVIETSLSIPSVPGVVKLGRYHSRFLMNSLCDISAPLEGPGEEVLQLDRVRFNSLCEA